MAFKFNKDEPAGAGIKRVFDERIQGALASLKAYPAEDSAGLHTARKHIKRARALLRLLRRTELRALGQSLNRRLRDAARILSSNRDREVLGALLLEWSRDSAAATPPALRRGIGKLLGELAHNGEPQRGLEPRVKRSARPRLQRARQAMAACAPGEVRPKDLMKAAQRAETRMWKAHACYLESPGLENFHDWRKSAKDHYYHGQLLRDFGFRKPPVIRKVAAMEDLLGRARDCDLLLSWLTPRTAKALSATELRALRRRAGEEHARLMEAARAVASGLPGNPQSPPPSKRVGTAKASRPHSSRR